MKRFSTTSSLRFLSSIVVLLLTATHSQAFSPLGVVLKTHFAIHSTTVIFSTPPPRQPRRMLKKRRRNPQRRNRFGGITTPAMEFPWDTAESRPLVKSISREVGEDYWIDEEELADFERQQQAIKNRKAMEGEVSKEKLWSEVKAPYKQNWIGYFSVVIAILSVIVIKFPELLDQPTITIPDL